jgi:hypothetical protein
MVSLSPFKIAYLSFLKGSLYVLFTTLSRIMALSVKWRDIFRIISL